MKKILISILAMCLVLAGVASAMSIGTISYTGGDSNALPSETLTGKFDITNDYPTTITNVIILIDGNFAAGTTNTIPGSAMTFSPSSVASMIADGTSPILFSVTVPAGTSVGTYVGNIKVAFSDVDGVAITPVTKSISFSVLEQTRLVAPSAITIESVEEQNVLTTFSLSNTGNVDLTGLTLTMSNSFTDDSSTPHTITFSNNFDGTVAKSTSKSITLTTIIPKDMSDDVYTGNLTISGGSLTTAQTIIIPVTVYIMPDLCEMGAIGGDLKLSIENVEDSYTAGDSISFEATVENNINDDVNVYVETWLYNLNKGTKVTNSFVKSEKTKISEDSDETFSLTFSPDPSKIYEDDKYRLYVKTYKSGDEDAQCSYVTKDISLEREETDVRVMSATVTPSSLSCGDNVAITLNVQNVGTEDDDTVYVQLVENTLLGTTGLVSDKFSLNDGKSTTKTFDFKVPAGVAPGDYTIQANVQYDEGRGHSGVFLTPLTVATCTIVPQITEDVTVTLVQDKIEALVDQTVSIPFTLTNNEEDDNVYTIEVSAVDDWAEKAVSTATVKAGESSTEYAYLTAKKGTVAGAYKATITVKNSDGDVLATKAVDVQLSSGNKVTGWFSGTGTIGSFFRNMFSGGAASTTMWIIIDIVIIVLAIWLLKLIFAKK